MLLEQHGYFWWSPNLKLDSCFLLSILWFIHNLALKSKQLELIMLRSLTCLIFSFLMESSINLVVFTIHNKILLWRGNISTSFPLLELCKFNPNFPLNFRVIVFYMLLPISLTGFLPLCCMTKHLLNSFFTSC